MAGHLILFLVGTLAGAINIIAGGGSFLTLPTLIFLGLPPGIANATNRLGIVSQNIGAVWSFHRWNVLHWDSLIWSALPATAGAAIGVWMALTISDALFQRVFAAMMVVIALWALFSPASNPDPERLARAKKSPFLFAAFFAVGIYGGFVQAGVGFLVLAVTTWAGLDLVKGNAVKVLSILIFTLFSLLIFTWNGRVEWVDGLWLAAGNTLGGFIGVRLTILKGHAWVKRVVTVAVVVFAIKLWFA